MNWQLLEECALDSLRMEVYFSFDEDSWSGPETEIQECGAEQLLAEVFGYA